jgi:hypothetical protein
MLHYTYITFLIRIFSYVSKLLNVRFRSNVTTQQKENQSDYVDNTEEHQLSVILHLLPIKLTSIIL